jgi:hypothetical protein
MKKLAALTLSMFLVYGTALADTPKEADAQPAKAAPPAKPKPAKKADKTDAAIAAQLEELRQALQSQQEQLQMLKEELAKRDRQIDEAREAAAAANARAAEASTKATEAVNSTAEVKSATTTLNSTVSDLKASNEVLKTTVATEQADAQKSMDEGPTTIRYKGISITPGGFLAAETVYRTRATDGDIATPFTGTPFQAANIAHLSENTFTGRQSRLSMLAQGKVGSATLTGYVEGDFLGVGTTSNNRQTNSYVFRQRQAFAGAAFENGVILTGGQMWSLATETKKGLLNRQEDLPMMIDPNYVVGFTWARQYGFRVVKDFGGKFAVGMSVEGPQATIGGRGFSTVTTINDAAAPAVIQTTGATSTITGNFFLNGPGVGGGLNNAFDPTGYTVNKAPDLIFKAAADPGFGHYEIFGIVSFFRDRVYPCGVVGTNANDTVPVPIVTPTTLTCTVNGVTSTTVSSNGATNTNTTGGGGGVSALWPLFHKKVDFGVKAVAGDGIGRYGSSQLVDATARPDGTLSLIRTAHGLGRIEWHATPKLDIYGYYGLEYAWRAGYQGYNSITITKTPAIPSNGTSPAIPATTTTKFTLNSIGGYGNVAANNTGCATEGVPANDFNPSNGANCAGDIRIIQEGTLGFWYRFYQGSKGRLQAGMAYSYLAKDAWSGTGGVAPGGAAISPKGINNMVWTSFRYYLP